MSTVGMDAIQALALMRRTSCLRLQGCAGARLQRVDFLVIVNHPYRLSNMKKILNKLKERPLKKGTASVPVLGASSAEPVPTPAPRPASAVSIMTPAPAVVAAAVVTPSVAAAAAAAPSGDTGFSTVWNGVLDVLRITQASLDSVPVPGLKSAIGGFLEIVRQLDTVNANVDAIRQLEDTVKFFNQSVSKPLETYEGKPSVPSELSEAIDALSGYVQIS
ncbi:uncharacterized protein EI90DRAFT_3017980 [Cantharellus anzutake]|uniref:uncharacterized protein n=1 Tax=Cantharellus anzutake TaxID=1750568 RepID=UPI0019084400|nr:uncharacterized protein EI90DRAFT_3017980 [Cantharellus anzutake]KAF8327728.1 hypothetical protein EI90DRAFT_3017980 [Cantharellus anzutake]